MARRLALAHDETVDVVALSLAAVVFASAPAPVGAPDSVALEHLAEAQRAREAGELDRALESADAAIEQEPDLPFAHLARAQILLDMVGDPDRMPEDHAAAQRWAQRLRMAAADLGRYLDLMELDATTRKQVETQRATLLAAADRFVKPVDEEPEPPVAEDARPEPPARPPPPRPNLQPVDRNERPKRVTAAGPLLMVSGAMLSTTGVALATGGIKVEQTCADLCTAKWVPNGPLLGPSIASSLVGAGLAGAGTYLLARDAPAYNARFRRRVVIGVLIGLGVTAAASGIATAALSGQQWDKSLPRDDPALSLAQLKANASLALFSSLPGLLAAAIGTAIGGKHRADQPRGRYARR